MALLDYSRHAAALCTTTAYVPQVVKAWRTCATEDIPLRMVLVLVTGLTPWLTDGTWRGELPLVIANSITLILASTILFFKLRHG